MRVGLTFMYLASCVTGTEQPFHSEYWKSAGIESEHCHAALEVQCYAPIKASSMR